MVKIELKTITDNKNKTKEYYINGRIISYDKWKSNINKYWTLVSKNIIKLGESYYTWCENHKIGSIKTLYIDKV